MSHFFIFFAGKSRPSPHSPLVYKPPARAPPLFGGHHPGICDAAAHPSLTRTTAPNSTDFSLGRGCGLCRRRRSADSASLCGRGRQHLCRGRSGRSGRFCLCFLSGRRRLCPQQQQRRRSPSHPPSGRAPQVWHLLLLQEGFHEEQAADEPHLPEEASDRRRRSWRIEQGQEEEQRGERLIENPTNKLHVLFDFLIPWVRWISDIFFSYQNKKNYLLYSVYRY